MVGAGVRINGDSPGKTDLHRDILLRVSILVESPPQTRIEGEIQQLAPDDAVTELWQVTAGQTPGRTSADHVTLLVSVGFPIEDLSALRAVRSKLAESGLGTMLDMIADPDDPRAHFEMLLRAASPEPGFLGKDFYKSLAQEIWPPSMQPELAHHIAPFSRSNKLAVGEAHRMQRAFDPFVPELDELEQFRIIECQIILLPDEAGEHISIIRHPIVKLGRGQPIASRRQFGLLPGHSALPF